LRELCQRWGECGRPKAFGIDVKKILERAAPVEKPKVAAAKPARKASRARTSA
jgi:hypothetical protein